MLASFYRLSFRIVYFRSAPAKEILELCCRSMNVYPHTRKDFRFVHWMTEVQVWHDDSNVCHTMDHHLTLPGLSGTMWAGRRFVTKQVSYDRLTASRGRQQILVGHVDGVHWHWISPWTGMSLNTGMSRSATQVCVCVFVCFIMESCEAQRDEVIVYMLTCV